VRRGLELRACGARRHLFDGDEFTKTGTVTDYTPGGRALQVAGAMAKGVGWRRSSLDHLSPSFPSAHDPAQYSCFDGTQTR
jgi:hypothetical protein